jgi:hypothetical protein
MQRLPVAVNLANTHMAADSDGGAKRERCLNMPLFACRKPIRWLCGEL